MKAEAAPSSGYGEKVGAGDRKQQKKELKLSEESVKEILTRKGQVTTINLINRFKAELSDPQKKAEFTKIVKKVAKYVEIPPGSGKKFLVLKDDKRK